MSPKSHEILGLVVDQAIGDSELYGAPMETARLLHVCMAIQRDVRALMGAYCPLDTIRERMEVELPVIEERFTQEKGRMPKHFGELILSDVAQSRMFYLIQTEFGISKGA